MSTYQHIIFCARGFPAQSGGENKDQLRMPLQNKKGTQQGFPGVGHQPMQEVVDLLANDVRRLVHFGHQLENANGIQSY